MLAVCLRSASIYNHVLYMLSLYVRHVNFCYGMLHCLCSGLVEVILIVQAQHINNRKLLIPIQKIMSVDRQIVSIYFAM
jgi:hypothetical protein